MTQESTAVPLVGSTRDPLPGARVRGELAADTTVQVTVYLRPREATPAPADGRILSRAELAAARGADPADVAAVEAFAHAAGLEVLEEDPAGRRVRLSGAAAAMEAAFGVQLQRFEHPDGSYRGHTGPIMLPSGVAGSVVAVLGLDDRPQAEMHLRHAKSKKGTSYTPVTVADAYGLAASAGAAGVCVALIELGGGYATADLSTYFAGLGLPVPAVVAVPVDGGANAPSGGASGPDGEVMLDIEVVGSVASEARIAVYFGPNTDQGFADAISAAVHDATNKPAVISISWGGAESTYTAQATAAFEAAFTDAALVGTTVFVAAGDGGSSDGATDGMAHVDYPASSPQVVGCGGTRLELDGGAISSEVVWDDLPNGGATGGGVSITFPLPAWQDGVGVPVSANSGGGPGRGVPDVAANADPETGYQIRVDGTDTVVGGTSAVAPLYAALAAIAVSQAGAPLGFINPTLYGIATSAFRDITSGTNGAYQAGPGWDPCTGLGSPQAATLIQVLVAHTTTSK
jgi:kumamolisin